MNKDQFIFSYGPDEDYGLDDMGKQFKGYVSLNRSQLLKLVQYAQSCLTHNSNLEINMFGEQDDLNEKEEKLIDEITRLKNAMTTAHTAMTETHRYLRDTLRNLIADKGTIWTTDVCPILTKLARSIETMAIWGCHE